MLGEPPSGLLMIILARPVVPTPPVFGSINFLSPLFPPETDTFAFASFSDFSRLYSPLWEDEACLEGPIVEGPPLGTFPEPPLLGADPEPVPPTGGPTSQPSSPTPPPPTLLSLSMTAVREGFLFRLGDFPLALGLLALF